MWLAGGGPVDEEAEERTEPAEAGYYWEDLGHVISILRV